MSSLSNATKRCFWGVLIVILALTYPVHAQTVTIAAVGDVLLDRGVAKEVRAHGYAYPFAHVRSTLRSADIVFANLECPLSTHGVPIKKRVAFKADPRMAACLVDGGVTIVSCANNHSMDCGHTGLVETMDTLRASGIRWCGAGETLPTAIKPTIITVHGIRVAFVGFCDFLPDGVDLRDDAPSLVMASEANVRKAVAEARREADVVVASFHWGVEFTDRPTDRQRHLAHVAAMSGADLVLGHHPHVLQGIEVVRNHGRTCLIDYSLGNFVFDEERGFGTAPERSIVLHVKLGRRGITAASIVPVVIRRCAPSVARGNDASAIEDQVSKLSAELGTTIRDGQLRLK